ncbi:MAG: alpha/beta hydrolase family protein [Acidobacteriaceae bacterium]
MLAQLYAKWMYAWETALTTRDENRVERPLEWGFEYLAEFGGEEMAGRVERGEISGLAAMIELNRRIVADPQRFYSYRTPTDFRIEQHFPALYPTNVRPETLEQEREWKRRAEVGELRKEPFLRFTSQVSTPYPENDTVNARWYEASSESSPKDSKGRPLPRQAMIVMPQWNADAFSHNVLCELFNRFGISCLRLSKPYHDVRRPPELERSDYAVSANVGRTIAACRQAVVDIRSCVDWLESRGYEQFGVLGTSLGSAYGFIAAAVDPRLRVCAFNHASTQFGDVVWTGQSTRHIKAAFEHADLSQSQVREMFAGVSPMSFMEQFAASGRPRWEQDKPRRTLVVYAPYDLTFVVKYSREVLQNFATHGVDYVAKVLPCGHYTTGEAPYKYLDGWYLGSFIWGAFRRLRAPE